MVNCSLDSISVCFELSPRERKKEEICDREKNPNSPLLQVQQALALALQDIVCLLYSFSVSREEKIVAGPGLEPRASRLPCKHSAN